MINIFIIILLSILLVIYIYKYFSLKEDIKKLNFNLKKKIGYKSISKNEIYNNNELNNLSDNLDKIILESNDIKNSLNAVVKDDRELMANISHDLRTPLTSIIGYLTLLENEKNEVNINRYLEIVKNKSIYLNALIEKFYELSLVLNRDEDIRKDYINLYELLVNNVFNYYDLFEEKNQKISLDAFSEKIDILTNESMISTCFHNILDNMEKYSEGNNEIKVSKNENIEIIFSNKCSNISDGNYNFLFDRLSVLDKSRKDSTGIGLAIVKAIFDILKYRADIYVKNNTFYLKIEIPA